jgi:hypothetical protein
LLDLAPDPHLIKDVAEVTLVWVLFADASRVRIADLRADRGLYLRLLALGAVWSNADPVTRGLQETTASSVVSAAHVRSGATGTSTLLT